MAKTLCEWSKKDFEDKPEKLAKVIFPVQFYCKKCGRCANDSKYLCKAHAFKEQQ